MIVRHHLNRSLGRFKLLLSAVFIVVGTLSPLGPQPLLAQANFYQGKTVRMIVGFQAGDNHDLWMRFYARFLGKQIPGNPDFFVQNMSWSSVIRSVLSVWHRCHCKIRCAPPKCWSAPYVI